MNKLQMLDLLKDLLEEAILDRDSQLAVYYEEEIDKIEKSLGKGENKVNITNDQLEAIKKSYLMILRENLLQRNKEKTIQEYEFYLMGFASAIGIKLEQLEDQLDRSMHSTHFIKQQIRFNSDEELFNHVSNELKYYK